MSRTTISFTREGMQLIQEATKRQGASVSQFVREAALMASTLLLAAGAPSSKAGREGLLQADTERPTLSTGDDGVDPRGLDPRVPRLRLGGRLMTQGHPGGDALDHPECA